METWHRREALLAWLRSRTTATSTEAADRFGVSTRTILRDVAALRENGEPIESDSGRGGGLRVDILRSLPPVRLQLDHIVGLYLWYELTRMSQIVPCTSAASGAIHQLMSVLPPSRAQEVRRTLKRVVVLGRPATPPAADAFEELLPIAERALNLRRGMCLTCRCPPPATGRDSVEVELQGLLIDERGWSLVATRPGDARGLLLPIDLIEGARTLDHVRTNLVPLGPLVSSATRWTASPSPLSSAGAI